MNNLAVYMNNNEDPQKDFISKMKTASIDQISVILQRSITKNNHQYFLKPVSGQMKLTMQKLSRNVDFSKPQFNAEFIFTELAFTFNDNQYRSMIHLLEYFSNYPSVERFRKYRPKDVPLKDKMGWWKYASMYTYKKQAVFITNTHMSSFMCS